MITSSVRNLNANASLGKEAAHAIASGIDTRD